VGHLVDRIVGHLADPKGGYLVGRKVGFPMGHLVAPGVPDTASEGVVHGGRAAGPGAGGMISVPKGSLLGRFG